MSRRKRASMREGPLSDLFRSTSDDAPADPPELGARRARSSRGRARGAGRGGRRAATTSPLRPRRARRRAADGGGREAEQPAVNEGSTEPAPERLKRVFSEEPRHARRELEPIVENPRYGREEPEYEPPGSGEPHNP